MTSECDNHPIIDSMPAFDADADSTEIPTILGQQRTNPYTLANMRQAYNNMGYSSYTVNATNLYVRFLPNSAAQLSILDSTLDAQNLEMFDAPMDYDILQEGDYYQDPSIPDSLPTWQYAVVPTNFVAPNGITYQVLSQIHIPSDDYEAVETEAERLASIRDSINCILGGAEKTKAEDDVQASTSVKKVKPNIVPQQCDPGYHWDDNLRQCVADGNCPAGYYWNSVFQICMPLPTSPPGHSPDAQVPAGMITVSDVNLGTTPGVRNVRVVAKRWFKIERIYTDNNGNFVFTKHFKHKVKIRVKFKNQYCNIRGIRGIRLWQSLYVVQNTLGVYSANKNNITYNYKRYTTSTNVKGNRYWVAATTINAVQEQRDYAIQYGFSAPPLGLNIYLTNWGQFAGLASTPLFGKRFVQNLPNSFINAQLVFLAANSIPLIGWYSSFFATVARAGLDMAIDYHTALISDFTSDYIKETEYHECSHASQYTYAGNNWYTNFVSAELAEQAAHPNTNDAFNPYGTGNTSNSPIIALGEAWGYHAGHFLADQRYGVNNSSKVIEQGIEYNNNNPITGLSSHLNLLEDFNPGRTYDPFHWIPKGLMYDLMDTRNESVPVVDGVSNFTIAQIFNALQADVTSLQQYRTRFEQQNPGNQTTQITNLFAQYGY